MFIALGFLATASVSITVLLLSNGNYNAFWAMGFISFWLSILFICYLFSLLEKRKRIKRNTTRSTGSSRELLHYSGNGVTVVNFLGEHNSDAVMCIAPYLRRTPKKHS